MRNQNQLKTSFLASKHFLLALLAFISFLGAIGHAQSSVSIIKQFPDGSYLIKVGEVEHWAVGLAKTKQLKQSENDAAAFKAQLQDERVKYSKLETLYGEQSTLLTSCMKLSKSGGALGNKWLQLGLDVAPTVTTLLRPCR